MKKAGLSSILIAVVLLAVAAIAEAQQPKKVLQIGYLMPSDAAADSTRSVLREHIRFVRDRLTTSASES
jgi:hypothetical protein